MAIKSAHIDRFLEFGQSLYGKEHGWKKRFAEALEMSPQALQTLISRESIGGIIQSRLRELGADVDYIMTGEEKKQARHCTPNDEELLKRLGEMGIKTVDQLNNLFSPENMAKDIAVLLHERQVAYKVKRKKK